MCKYVKIFIEEKYKEIWHTLKSIAIMLSAVKAKEIYKW